MTVILQWLTTLTVADRIALFVGIGSIVIGVVAALAGAWFGSHSAFKLARRQQKQDLRDKRHSALIGTQYALISQWNLLEGIRQKFLEPNRHEKQRFIRMDLFFVTERAISVPLSDITFIAESEDPNLLQEIYLSEQQYLACLHGLEILRDEVDKFHSNPNLLFKDFDLATGIARLEPAKPGIDLHRETFRLKEATDGVYDVVDRAIPAMAEIIPKLAKFMLKEFPNQKALGFTPISKSETGLPASGKSG